MKGSRFAVVFVFLLLASACDGQSAPAPEINTASAGVQPADINAAVGVICGPANITRSKDGTASGCRVCPKGTNFQGQRGSQWGVYAETPGHFTSPQDDNLILSGSGCDSHANNFGGSFVFSLKAGKPRLLKYNPGLITDSCHKFALADGRDFLVCKGGWGGMGENDGVVFATTFDAAGKDSTTNLIRTTDTTAMCGDDPDEVFQESDIRNVAFATGDTGKITGLTITATLGNIRCSAVKTEQKTGKSPATLKTYSIEFLFDGKRFKVAPASRAALNRFTAN
jgi:hypothetical protein